MNFINRLRTQIANSIHPNNQLTNKFNQAFLWGLGGGYTEYDINGSTYVEQGYNHNPFVYSMVNQMSTKTASIPYYIKKIDDKDSMHKLNRLRMATKMELSPQQHIEHLLLENKAFDQGELPFPMHMPNPNQTWSEFISLYKTFINLTGNAYIYLLTVEEGANAGMPMAAYLLPSHNIQIVIKNGADFLTMESPIEEYILIEANRQISFDAKDIIHIKYSNPNYGVNGQHLYGQSKLRAALHNIQSSNIGLDLNIKTLKSGGAFGFIHGKNTPITVQQAAELKERLVEMDASRENLSKIAGVSAEMGFTRISLTSDELKPFDYFAFDEKQISEVLVWAIDDGNRGDFGGTMKEIKRTRVIDNIVPDLNLLTQALNHHFLPRFKGYENTVIEFDVMELPEMQEDLAKLSEWLYKGLDRGTFTRNEVRKAMRWIESNNQEMERFTVANDIISLEESLNNDLNVG